MEYYPPGGLVSATNNPSQDPLQTPATTGGSSTAYTLTDTRIGTPADGQVFAFIPHTNSGPSPTLSVNGGSARPIRYPDATLTSFRDIATAQLIPQQAYMVRLVTGSGIYQVLSKLSLATSDMPAAKAFIAHKAASQTISSAATTRLTWDAASRNDSLFTVSGTGNITMTAVLTGVYAVCADIYASGTFELEIWVNGSRYHSGPVVSSSAFINSIVPLAAGDTIEIYLYAQSGAISPDASYAYLSNLRIARIN